MKPYFDDGKGRVIYHGDCREILPTLPKCDLVLTDPPYLTSLNPVPIRGGGVADRIEESLSVGMPWSYSLDWIRCEERTPKDDELIFWTEPPFKNVYATDYTHKFLDPCDYWAPVRNIPAPPVEEESELVKELKSKLGDNCGNVGISWAIEIVKKHEKAGKQ